MPIIIGRCVFVKLFIVGTFELVFMFEADVCVRRWVQGLAESTVENRVPLLKSFFEFVGVQPCEAVEWQRAKPVDYRFVDAIYEWLKQYDLAVSTMETREGCVRGFFVANRVPLPEDKHRFHSSREPVFGELTVEDFRKILFSCSLVYQATFLVQFQSGSGAGEVVYINTHHAEHVWNEVRNGKKIIMLPMPGRKQNRNAKPYYTFVGMDAVETLKRLFHSQGWRRDDVLFRDEYGEPISATALSSYFRRHAIKTGVVKRHTFPCLDCGGETVKQVLTEDGVRRTYYVCTVSQHRHWIGEYKNVDHHVFGGIRYKARTHELRDLFRTQCHYAQRYAGFDGDCAEFFLEHEIDPLKYDKIMRDVTSTMSEYRKLMPFLNVLSEDPLKMTRTDVESQFDVQRREVEALRRRLAEDERMLDVFRKPEVREWLVKKMKEDKIIE